MNEEQAKRFGEWLRERRQQAGLSTIQLAKAVGISDATVSRIEQGAFAAPDPHKLSRIADVLRLSLADVYAMADYAVPSDLPSFEPYLRRKYRGLPAEAVEDLDKAFERIAKRHGYNPAGPRPGEDESPEVKATN